MANRISVDEARVDTAISELRDLIDRVDRLDVSSERISGDQGSAASQMTAAETDIDSLKLEMKGLINDTIDTLTIIKANALGVNTDAENKVDDGNNEEG